MCDYRTLCAQCADDYRSAGYVITLCRNQTHKQQCDKCDRMGWVYAVREMKCGGNDGTGMG